ncbi:MAG: hypothetical protein QM537_05445 [Candidatus Symbiobacter sp.]|nr:hypothetical protein [Candidatus Symbiobacter sp.]
MAKRSDLGRDQARDLDEGSDVNLPLILQRLSGTQRADVMRRLYDLIRQEKNHREAWQRSGQVGEAASAILSEHKAGFERKITQRLGGGLGDGLGSSLGSPLGTRSIDWARGNN